MSERDRGRKKGIAEESNISTPRKSLVLSPVRGVSTDGKKISEENMEKVNGVEKEFDILSIINELNGIIVNDTKMLTGNKQKACAALAKLSETVEEIKIENVKLKTELKVLKNMKSSTPILTFAEIAQKPKVQPSMEKVQRTLQKQKHTIFVTSEEGKSTKEVQEIITQNLKPVEEKIRISHMRATERNVIIETESEEDMNKILNSKGLVDKNLKMEKPKKRNPLVILYDVLAGEKEETLKRNLYQQNFDHLSWEEFDTKVYFKFRTGPRNRAVVHHVLEVDPKIRHEMVNKGRMYLGFQSVSAKDFIVVARCLKCQDLGHVAKFCKKEENVCHHCGDIGHSRNDCKNKDQPKVCIPCNIRKKKCAGGKDCGTYKMFWDRLISRTNYE